MATGTSYIDRSILSWFIFVVCLFVCFLTSGPKKFLLLTQRSEIRILSLSTAEHRDLQLPIKNIGHVVGVDFDPVKEQACWIDSQYYAIKCARLNGSGKYLFCYVVA
jgi:hypothetical protein